MKRKGFFEVTVNQCFETGGEVFLLELGCDIKVKGGQFILLEPLNKDSVMPRPFSVHNCEDGKISILFKKVGANTELYSRLEAGDKIKIAGPLGKPLLIEPEARRYFLVGGGIGAVPLGLIGRDLHSAGKEVRFLFGAKTVNELVNIAGFQSYGNVEAITEVVKDKHFGKGGLVTDLLGNRLKHDKYKSVVVACGPNPMLKKVAEMCAKSKNKCYVVMEEIMACGVGSCKGCAVFGNDGTVKHVCKDGPFFDAEWVDWKKFSHTLSLPPLPKISRKTKYPMEIVLKGREGRELILPSPVLNGSGCLDYPAINNGSVDVSCAGALVTKGVEVNPSVGNSLPRICETTSGMINSIGLENPGIANFISSHLSQWAKGSKQIIVNICGRTVKEYVTAAKRLHSSHTGIAASEINISCPNIEKGGMAFGVSAAETYTVVEAVRKTVPNMFLIIKLTPNVTDIASIAKAAYDAGADAISLINTVQAMSIDVKTRRPKIAKVMGGLSGSAIKPMAVRMVHQVAKALPGVPIIGMGGIETAEDAAEFIIAGASVVAVGTGLFKNPNAITEIYNGLLEIMHYHGANSISDLSGSIILPE